MAGLSGFAGGDRAGNALSFHLFVSFHWHSWSACEQWDVWLGMVRAHTVRMGFFVQLLAFYCLVTGMGNRQSERPFKQPVRGLFLIQGALMAMCFLRPGSLSADRFRKATQVVRL